MPEYLLSGSICEPCYARLLRYDLCCSASSVAAFLLTQRDNSIHVQLGEQAPSVLANPIFRQLTYDIGSISNW